MVAVSGPWFCTIMVNITVSCRVGLALLTVFVSSKAAAGGIAMLASAWLLASTGSYSVCDVLFAWLVMVVSESFTVPSMASQKVFSVVTVPTAHSLLSGL